MSFFLSLCFVPCTTNIVSYLLDEPDFSNENNLLLEKLVLQIFFFLLYLLKKSEVSYFNVIALETDIQTTVYLNISTHPPHTHSSSSQWHFPCRKAEGWHKHKKQLGKVFLGFFCNVVHYQKNLYELVWPLFSTIKDCWLWSHKSPYQRVFLALHWIPIICM